MIFDFKEISCILEVLKILNKRSSKYTLMFRKTKVSHITLQKALKELAEKKFIIKYNKGHQDVDYEISEKGRKVLNLLLQLKELTH